jgi:hypothetical protein
MRLRGNIWHRPFKGSFFYEWQFGPLVFQWKRRDYKSPHFRRFHVWYDRYWRV